MSTSLSNNLLVSGTNGLFLISPLVLGQLSEDSMETGSISSGIAPRQFKSKLEEALTAKQESEAKVAALQEKIGLLESGGLKDGRVCTYQQDTVALCGRLPSSQLREPTTSVLSRLSLKWNDAVGVVIPRKSPSKN